MQKIYVEKLNVVNQILRYVIEMKDITLKYSKFPSFILLGYPNSNYGGEKDDRKSISAYVFNIGSSVIS